MMQIKLTWENFKLAIAKHKLTVYYLPAKDSVLLYAKLTDIKLSDIAEYSVVLLPKDFADWESTYKGKAVSLI